MIDEEISKLYLKKDFNKFWHKWKSKFNRLNLKVLLRALIDLPPMMI